MRFKPNSNWSAIWVGALSALAVALIISLCAAALGAQQLGPGGKIAKWSDIGFAALVFAIVGAFAAFVTGGWVAGKINGFRRAETDMLHGAIVWLVTVPLLVALAATGAGTLFGGWYAGLAGVPVWATPSAAVGSSRITASLPQKTARATATDCRWPPERVSTVCRIDFRLTFSARKCFSASFCMARWL